MQEDPCSRESDPLTNMPPGVDPLPRHAGQVPSPSQSRHMCVDMMRLPSGGPIVLRFRAAVKSNKGMRPIAHLGATERRKPWRRTFKACQKSPLSFRAKRGICFSFRLIEKADSPVSGVRWTPPDSENRTSARSAPRFTENVLRERNDMVVSFHTLPSQRLIASRLAGQLRRSARSSRWRTAFFAAHPP